MKKVILFLFMVMLAAQSAYTQDMDEFTTKNLHYRMGGIGVFAEIVRLGVKKMAFSATMSSEDATEHAEIIDMIVKRNGVEHYREDEILITDLYHAAPIKDKTVYIIYKGDTLDKYLALKKRKQELIAAGQYNDEGRREITFGLGRLMSYPDELIEEKIKLNRDRNAGL